MDKIVIFTGGLMFSVRKGIAEILDSFPGVEVLVVHQTARKPLKRLVRNQIVNLKMNGWRWIPYQASDLAARVAGRLLPEKQFSQDSAPGVQYAWQAIVARPNVDYLPCQNLHAPDVLQRVESFAPELGLALAAPILREQLFTIPRLGTINLHKGKVPDYRGMPPAFWELWHGEKEVGCTIHKVEAGLDTGDILLQRCVRVASHATVKGMQLILDEQGVEMMVEAIRLLDEGKAEWHKQPDGGRTFRKPTLKQQAELNRRLAGRAEDNRIKGLLKGGFFLAYLKLHRPLVRLLSKGKRQPVVVLLYHRVNDEQRDSVTVGIEQFDQHMAILAKSYRVVSIEDIIRGTVRRDGGRPIIAVTFDDGYRDNHDHAAPILLRHGLPAAFFVSTGIVGTDNGFQHDIDKLGGALPNMSWEQIRHMHDIGFTIGSHTVNHINCAKDDPQRVREEIVESKQVLEEKLGLDEVIFAYPFGKREDMNDEMRDYVRQVGYAGCLSAYGGINEDDIDPFNVLRMGIDYKFSPLAFRARLEGFSR